MSTSRQFITTAEVASHFACSEETIRRMARDRQIPYIKIRDQYRFDLDAVMRRLRAESNAPPHATARD